MCKEEKEQTVPIIKGGVSNCSSFKVSLDLYRFCVLTVLLGPRIVLAWLATLVIEPRPPRGKGYVYSLQTLKKTDKDS